MKSSRSNEFTNNIIVRENLIKALSILKDAIPKDIRETGIYHETEKIKNKDITYNEVINYIRHFKCQTEEEALEFINSYNIESSVDNYIKEIITNRRINKRDKAILILSHIERLVYETTNAEKEQGIKDNIKEDVEQNTKPSVKNYGKVIVLGITKIVFANTDSFKNPIDRRVPFRNDILHNGIVDYNDEEIEYLYELLLIFVSQLLFIKNRNHNE